jgi:hypothetical protein
MVATASKKTVIVMMKRKMVTISPSLRIREAVMKRASPSLARNNKLSLNQKSPLV